MQKRMMSHQPRRVLPWLLGLALVMGVAACGDDDGGNDNDNQNNTVDSRCGNGELDGSEECDEGAGNSDSTPDGCRTDCRAAHCGDGVTDAGEECDEGAFNADVPNVCRSDCRSPACGDGLVDTAEGETCDDGNQQEDDGCSAACLVEFCGNSVLDPGEVCDDGNLVSGDGCSADCRVPCGDGVVNSTLELCDTTPPPGETCQSYGYSRGRLGCSSLCMPDFTGCQKLGWHSGLAANTAGLVAFWAAAPDDVWAVGHGGLIVHFDGTTWTTEASGTTESLAGIWGSGPSDVWAVGDLSTILHWDGTAWTAEAGLPTVGYVRDVHGTGPNDVWAVANSEILHNDGSGWQVQPDPGGDRTAVWAFAPNDVWAMGNGAVAWHWDGNIWDSVPTPLSSAFWRLWASGPTDLWATSLGGVVLHFDGFAWTQVNLPVSDSGRAVFGTGPTDVWLGDETTVHFDGRAFSEHLLPSGVHDRRVGIAPLRTRAWLAGDGREAMRFDGGGWGRLAAPAGVHSFSLLPDGRALVTAGSGAGATHLFDGAQFTQISTFGQYGVWAAAVDDVWVPDGGDLGHYDGSTWSWHTDPNIGVTRFLTGTGPNNIWGSGTGEIIRYDSTWDSESPSGDLSVASIWLDPAGLPWAIGWDADPQAHLWRFDGTAWAAEDVVGGGTPLDIWGTSAANVWMVGELGFVARYDGTTWAVQTPPTSAQLNSVRGLGTDDVWAVGAAGTVLRFDGVAWSPVSFPEAVDLEQVDVSPRFVWVRTTDGELWRLLRNVAWECAATEACGNGVDDDCDGLADAQDSDCDGGCADGSMEQVFGNGMVGCGGTVSFADRATLCGAGWSVCSARQWVRGHGLAGPTHSYWTDDDLRYLVGGTSGSCTAVETGGVTTCSPDQPIRVCAGSTDPLGNTCSLTRCGLDNAAPNQHFGGCLGDLTAGALCCAN